MLDFADRNILGGDFLKEIASMRLKCPRFILHGRMHRFF